MATDGKKPGTGLVIAGIVLMLLAGIVTVLGFARGTDKLSETVSEIQDIDQSIETTAGSRYSVWSSSEFGFGEPTVMGPDGSIVEITPEFGTSTFTINGRRWTGAGSFTSTSGGTYRVEPTNFAIAPEIGFGQIAGGFGSVLGGLALGFLFGIAGLVLLILGLVKKSKASKPTVPPTNYQNWPAAPHQPPTGQYPAQPQYPAHPQYPAQPQYQGQPQYPAQPQNPAQPPYGQPSAAPMAPPSFPQPGYQAPPNQGPPPPPR